MDVGVWFVRHQVESPTCRCCTKMLFFDAFLSNHRHSFPFNVINDIIDTCPQSNTPQIKNNKFNQHFSVENQRCGDCCTENRHF